MKYLIALAGLLSILANPASAAIDTSNTKDYAASEKSHNSCQRNIFNHSGLIVEFEISCGSKSVIFVYSPIEKMFCDPKFNCQKSLKILTKTWFSNNYAEFK